MRDEHYVLILCNKCNYFFMNLYYVSQFVKQTSQLTKSLRLLVVS